VSFDGCTKNLLPLFIFSLLYLLVAILASIPFALGWFVLGPMTFGMWYAIYRDTVQA
jgi:hypothetical protein